MAVLSFISQKGGVGKSTLARLVARELAVQDYSVLVADMDLQQGSSIAWGRRRLAAEVKPEINVQSFNRVPTALQHGANFDALIFDGAPHATSTSEDIAKACDLVVIPTGLSVDDMEPAVILAQELERKGTKRERISFALCRVGNSETEIAESRAYLEQARFHVLPGAIPEMVTFRRASDMGRALSESNRASLNEKADELAQAVFDRLEKLTK